MPSKRIFANPSIDSLLRQQKGPWNFSTQWLIAYSGSLQKQQKKEVLRSIRVSSPHMSSLAPAVFI